MAIYFHYMPENRLATDLHHGLWADAALLADARPEAACQDHCFHARAMD